MLKRLAVEDPRDGMIGDRLDIDDGRFQVRELEIAKFIPVDDVGIKIESKAGDDILNVLYGQFRVPAVVQMNGQGAEALLFGDVGDISAVHPSAHTDDTIIRATTACVLDLLDQPGEFGFGLCSRGNMVS